MNGTYKSLFSFSFWPDQLMFKVLIRQRKRKRVVDSHKDYRHTYFLFQGIGRHIICIYKRIKGTWMATIFLDCKRKYYSGGERSMTQPCGHRFFFLLTVCAVSTSWLSHYDRSYTSIIFFLIHSMWRTSSVVPEHWSAHWMKERIRNGSVRFAHMFLFSYKSDQDEVPFLFFVFIYWSDLIE